jgi:hypothetical protein
MAGFRRARLFDGASPDGPYFAPDHATVKDPDLVQRMLIFLGGGSVVSRASGLVLDVVNPARGRAVPVAAVTDGQWIWTAAHAYYLRNYQFCFEDDFMNHMAAVNYQARTASKAELAAALALLHPNRTPPPEAGNEQILEDGTEYDGRGNLPV